MAVYSAGHRPFSDRMMVSTVFVISRLWPDPSAKRPSACCHLNVGRAVVDFGANLQVPVVAFGKNENLRAVSSLVARVRTPQGQPVHVGEHAYAEWV